MEWVEQLGKLAQHSRVTLFWDSVYELFRCNIGLHVRAQGETAQEAIADAWEQWQRAKPINSNGEDDEETI